MRHYTTLIAVSMMSFGFAEEPKITDDQKLDDLINQCQVHTKKPLVYKVKKYIKSIFEDNETLLGSDSSNFSLPSYRIDDGDLQHIQNDHAPSLSHDELCSVLKLNSLFKDINDNPAFFLRPLSDKHLYSAHYDNFYDAYFENKVYLKNKPCQQVNEYLDKLSSNMTELNVLNIDLSMVDWSHSCNKKIVD